jgi:hypothetical protein
VPEKTQQSAGEVRQLKTSIQTMLVKLVVALFSRQIYCRSLSGWAWIAAEMVSSTEKFLAIMIQQPAFWIALSLFIPIIFIIMQWGISEIVIVIRNYSARSSTRLIKQIKRS